ncbi:uncharacterized protein LOC130993078 [Salvia miltiorrhiza]|uniref:uncharacterized protein LOC130993078 n=1 Tax=Salvia miltiorrhiza TaxID=226208 RepID=UPI0025AD8ED5|nr:uncharacterized protein LOC130993078 [Salvia miltiorrhiza]
MAVPHKAMVLAWRLLRNRLPTCDNLRRRNILVGESECSCNACILNMETANHIFLHCPKTERVWDGIFQWLGMNFIRPHCVASHFIQFVQLGKGKRSEKLLEAVWSCTCWLVWKWRNESRWEGKNWDIKDAIMEIKARIWSWNKIFNYFESDLNFSSWMSCNLSNWLL